MRFRKVTLLLTSAGVALGANAQTVQAQLELTVELHVSCRIRANVPRVGTAERIRGGASIAVDCVRAASASARPCDPCRPAQDEPRAEWRVQRPASARETVATLLF